MKRWTIWAAVAGVLVAAVGVYYWQSEVTDRNSSAGLLAGDPNALAQLAPPAAPETFKDTSMLRAPAGVRVAVYEFDDLECPACAKALPIMRATVAQYGIPLVHHDYPLTEIHTWSFDAAVTARYLQDKVSAEVADNFRRDVFANQTMIANLDDLKQFTQKWFKTNGVTMPFVMDATGSCKQEVEADRALGDRIGIHGTPCIFVVTQDKWQQVPDVSYLSKVIEAAIAQTKA